MHIPHMAGLDLNLALVLHALIAERSVSRAAKRLGLSQSATSHDYRGEREQLGAWSEKKGTEGIERYQREKNAKSIDGLPGLSGLDHRE